MNIRVPVRAAGELIIGRNAEALAEMQRRFGVRVSDLDSKELRGTGAAIQD